VKFHRADPSFHYRALRLLSESGGWELGMSPYSHGVRLRMGRAGRPPSVLDVCMGHDERAFLPILVAVTRHLAPLAESASAEEIDAVFPWAGTRPDLAVHLSALLGEKAGV
jgi:hypothetical protein